MYLLILGQQSVIYLSLILAAIAVFPLNRVAVAGATQPRVFTVQKIPSQENVIYVNPSTGRDETGKGTEVQPFKTITFALTVAKPKTKILLARGTYSAETGEEFPLVLKTDVTIVGNSRNQGQNVIIEGNGTFLSPTSAGQHVAIAATHKAAGLIGVQVINRHDRGYGLWIESASPQIANNTFAHNGSSGVSVNGNSAPIIANNYFYNNRGNGLVIYGNSKPQVRDNVFQKTGFGISIVGNSFPVLTGNQIVENGIGVILEGNARAILRNNIIETNSQNGLVAIGQSLPDLGTADDSGGNTFRRNRGLDIHNITKKQVVNAFGNQIDGRTEGKIDLAGRSKPVTSPPTSRSKLPPLPARSDSADPPETLAVGGAGDLPPLTPLPQPPEFETSSENLPPPPSPPSSPPSPPSERSLPSPPPSPPSTRETSSSNRRSLSDILVVAPSRLPNGNPRVSPNAQTGYRVIVEILNSNQQQQLRSLYPEAFSTVHNGKQMWQVGVFSTQENAEKTLRNLNNLGIIGLIVSL